MTDTAAPPGRPPSRLGLYLPFSILAVIVIAWSGFWFYARSQAEQALDLWLSLERGAGRIWTCDDRQASGYPFRMEIRCDKPSFAGPVRDESGRDVAVKGTLGGFAAEALVYNPNRLIATLRSPLQVSDDQGRGATITWANLRASIEGKPGRLDQFSLEAEQPAAVLAGTAEAVARARHLEFHVRQTPDAERGTYDVASDVDGAIVPVLDGLIGNPDPVDLELQARATKVLRLDAGNRRALLDAWQQAGGRVQLALLRLRKGPTNFEAKGDLGIDEQHFPQGRLSTSIVGADRLLAAFGLGGGKFGGVLGAILGGGSDANGEAKGLRLALRLENGRAAFGPFSWRLAPLY